MLQPRKNSATVTLLLILFISIFFIFQAILQKGEENSFSIPDGGDLAVIGGSTAAFISALEGVKAGAKVFIFPNGGELLEDTSFLVSEGLTAISTPAQYEQDIAFTSENLKEMIQNNGKGVADPQLLEAFVLEADSLYSSALYYGGIEFDNLPDSRGKPYFHLSSLLDAGEKFKERLREKVEKEGVLFRPEKVLEICFLQDGERVQSLLLENDEGELFHFYVQGVILADGGYSGDIQSSHLYLPQGNLVNLRPEQKGKGLKLALQVKADFVQTGFLNKKILLYNSSNSQVKEFFPEKRNSLFFFNSKGQLLTGDVSLEECSDFILRSPEGRIFVLVPEEIALEESEFFQSFDSLDELVEACRLREAPLFPVSVSSLSSYYLADVRVGIDYTPGGLSVTPLGEVKNEEGGIIRGLYAAGEITGGLNGEGLLPGMALSETFFLAERAGRSAAEYARR